MAILGLIYFQIGLHININANEGQNKFEVNILKYVAKMTNYLPKIKNGPRRHFCVNAKWP